MDVDAVIRSWEERGPDIVVLMASRIVAELQHVADHDAAAFGGAMLRFIGHEHTELSDLAVRAQDILRARSLVAQLPTEPRDASPVGSGEATGWPDGEELLAFRDFDGDYEVFAVAEMSDDLLLDNGVQDWDALLEEQDVWFGQLIEGLCASLPSPAAEVLRASVTRSPEDLVQLCRIVDGAVHTHDVSADVMGMRAGLHMLREGAMDGAYGNDAHMWVPAVINGVMLSVPAAMRGMLETRVRGSLVAIAGEEL